MLPPPGIHTRSMPYFRMESAAAKEKFSHPAGLPSQRQFQSQRSAQGQKKHPDQTVPIAAPHP